MLGSRCKLVVLLAGVALAAGFGPGAIAGADSTITTPGPSTFTVPSNVCSVNVSASGAQGGNGSFGEGFEPDTLNTSPGGKGANVTGSLPVTPGEQLGVNVGGAGANSTPAAAGAGGINGGAPGGGPGSDTRFGGGAGGGGASDVRQASGGSGCVPVCQTATPPSRPGSTLNDRVVTAGGGGGGGGDNIESLPKGNGGAGGGTATGTPTGNGLNGDLGANAGQAGASGAAGGTSATPSAAGQNGTAGSGGAGGVNAGNVFGGGGGGAGGGQVGGGGGAGASPASSASGGGGGGGGSSAVGPTVTNATSTPGVQASNGQVSLGFTPSAPAACAVVASARLTG
jgi:hypothetical protein